ncbi:MAG: FMN-binding protein, partial [candidate division WOR-3 bacterium]|nr:FMN-binding protein [candidate division WOR-3 bacterium]
GSVSKPFPHRVVRDSSGRVLGYEVFSDSAGVTSMGYSGMVPVQVLLDAQAKPVRIYVLDNSESPAYLDIVLGGGLLGRLLAYDPARPESIDAVTLATSSSKAIIAGVTGLAARVSAEIAPKPDQGSR